ncbi:MAG: hypothetical protein RLZZ14_134 [Actinomycetota bacterium]
MESSNQSSDVTRRGLVGALLTGGLTAVASVLPNTAFAQPTAKCVRVGQKIIFNGYAYSCIRKSGRLMWKRGKKIRRAVASPVATATSSPIATPTSTPTPAATSTPSQSPSSAPSPTPSLTSTPTPIPTPTPSATVKRSGFFIAKSNQIAVGESKIFTGINLAGRSVKLSLFRSASGVSAVDIYCTHAGCAVTPNGPELVCECHFSYFDAATGARKSGPAPTGLPTFTTSEIDGEIYVLTS